MQAEVMTATRTKREQNRTEYDDGESRVVLTNARFYCACCGRWRPASKFGKLRRMGDGTIRNQPHCSDCR